MLLPEPAEHSLWLTRLADHLHLKEERYGCYAPSYRLYAKRFLSYLQGKGLTVHTVQPSDIGIYLNTLRARRKSDRKSRPSRYLRVSHRSAIHMLLRLVHGRWPVAPVSRSEQERFRDQLISDYDLWMRDRAAWRRRLDRADVLRRGVSSNGSQSEALKSTWPRSRSLTSTRTSNGERRQ